MNQLLRWIIIFIGSCVAVIAVAIEVSAQTTEGFLYARIQTANHTYTGPVRWGTEEVLWTDFFNAAKTTDQYVKLVPEQKNTDSWLNFDWSFSSIWDDKLIAHQFTCRFGDLAQITVLANRRAKLRFRNGAELVVDGEGYNDLNSKIQIHDSALGVVGLNWSQIRTIDFLPTPSNLELIFGMPLYGTVESVRRETFTGLIIWDNDEHVGSDKLDGDAKDGKMAIRFDDIGSIEKKGAGSLVTLRSGREVLLTGSNDVNSDNRGVVVITEDKGIVKLSWPAFRRINFSPAPTTGPSYAHFDDPSLLTGKVSQIEGNDLSGRIVFDIDESLDFEFLEGMENDIEYHIPFRMIKRITPKNYDYSMIELRSGKTLLLGGLRDVSSKNGGLLVFRKGEKEPTHVHWKKIYEIVFD